MKRKFTCLSPLVLSPGIYKIYCTETDKVYIGETVNLSNRIVKHLSRLRHNKHHNKWLQNIFNKHGEEKIVVDIIEYCNNASKIELKEKELHYQQIHVETCINFDKNMFAWNKNASEETILANKLQLDSIREQALEKWRTPIVVYDIENDAVINCKYTKDALKLVERKHFYKNIKNKIYTPYNGYVCFLPNEFDKSKVLKTYNKKIGVFTSVCSLFDLRSGTKIDFPNKNQFSLHFSECENWQLYDNYLTYIDPDFRTAIKINSEEILLNTMYCLRYGGVKIKLKEYIQALFSYKNKISFASSLNINRRTASRMISEKSISERKKEVELVLAAVKSI